MNKFTKEQIKATLDYAEQIKITAKVDSEKNEVLFEYTPKPPADLPGELVEEVEYCTQYYQRLIFADDLDHYDTCLPAGKFDNALDEINYNLKRYKPELVKEVRKALSVAWTPVINSYAQTMLHFRREMADYRDEKEQEKSEEPS